MKVTIDLDDVTVGWIDEWARDEGLSREAVIGQIVCDWAEEMGSRMSAGDVR